MFTIFEIGGKQYKVSPKEKIKIEKIEGEPGQEKIFDQVLLFSDKDKIEIGQPYLDRKIKVKILKQGREKKKIVFRYKSKTRHRKKKGHRQPYTEIEIQ